MEREQRGGKRLSRRSGIAPLLVLFAAAMLFAGMALLEHRGRSRAEETLSSEISAREAQARADAQTIAALEEETERLKALLPPEREVLPEKEAPAGELTAAEILRSSPVIAHALGTVDGIPSLNSRESFLAAYRSGVRIFEADFRLTRDGEVILRHDWDAPIQKDIGSFAIPTMEEFLSVPIQGKYTPMSFRDLLKLMEEYPDICVVTDSKYTDSELVTLEFEAMVRDAHELGLSYLFSRMAVQVYSRDMFRVVDHVHHFPCYIYTLYADNYEDTESAFTERADFCRENGIQGITMWFFWWKNSYAAIARERGLMTFVHTVNEVDRARRLLSAGVDGIYTDTLTPARLG